MSEERDPLAKVLPRSLDEIVAVMVEHGMTPAEARRAVTDPSRIPEEVKDVLRLRRAKP